MADEGRALTDKIQARMERAITREYRHAHKEVQAKLDEYLARFEREDKRLSMEVKSGRMTMKDYQDWRVRHIGMGQRWEELRDTLAEDLHNTNQIAMSIAKGYMPEVYALNYNYGTFAVERQGNLDTSFTLIDHNFVERLVRENPKLLPDPTPGSPAAIRIVHNKDVRWNSQKLQSAMIQGCLQGESIGKIADRFQRVTDMNRRQALLHSRTSVCGAANGGRHDAHVRAERMGIDLVEEWSAVLDSFTRDSHLDMDGERKPVDQELWSNGLRFPGDPFGKPAEVYNCFVGETVAIADSEIQRSYKHRYDGELITIKTARGVQFSCTPNHPILSARGWIAANMLNEGDDLVITSGVNVECARINPNVDHVFASMETLHELVNVLGGERTTALGVNFHGDVAASEVEIVTKERFLWNNRDAGEFEEKPELRPIDPDESLLREGSFVKHFGCVCKAALGLVRRLCKPLALFWRGLRHSKIHGFRTISLSNSAGIKPLDDSPSGSPELVCKNLDRLAGVVFLDKIVDINVNFFHGDVYNLQTENGYYFVNSSIACNSGKEQRYFAIAHNCRCDLLSWVKGFEPSGDFRIRENEVETFSEWQKEHQTIRFANVTHEYRLLSTPREGKFIIENGFKNHNGELQAGEWIHQTFGGDIKLLKETQKAGQKKGENPNPDYNWNGKLWDLKKPTSPNGISDRVRDGIHQIAKNPGGVIIDISKTGVNGNRAIDEVYDRMRRVKNIECDVMIVMDGKLLSVRRYFAHK